MIDFQSACDSPEGCWKLAGDNIPGMHPRMISRPERALDNDVSSQNGAFYWYYMSCSALFPCPLCASVPLWQKNGLQNQKSLFTSIFPFKAFQGNSRQFKVIQGFCRKKGLFIFSARPLRAFLPLGAFAFQNLQNPFIQGSFMRIHSHSCPFKTPRGGTLNHSFFGPHKKHKPLEINVLSKHTIRKNILENTAKNDAKIMQILALKNVTLSVRHDGSPAAVLTLTPLFLSLFSNEHYSL